MSATLPLPDPLRAVTFDCWSTLLVEEDWPTAHARRVEALCDVAREAGRGLDRAEASRCFDEAWQRHMTLWRQGVTSGASHVARWTLESLAIEERGDAYRHLVSRFEEASHSGRVTALDGARATLTGLRTKGVRCGLVCDTGLTPGRVVRRHLERLGMLVALESHAFSDEVGIPKPHRRAFESALTPLGVRPEEAVHVGDLRATDVAGARAVGMTTVRIRAAHDDEGDLQEADFVVDSHAELQELLCAAGPSFHR